MSNENICSEESNTLRTQDRHSDTAARTIFHVDVNSAFLSWSALKRLKEEPGSVDLRTIPSAVGGDVRTRHGIITAKSIPAKKYGIRTGEPVVKALQKCPSLVLVPADFDTYRKNSRLLMNLLSGYTSLLQQISIDEAWLDVSGLLTSGTREESVRLADAIRQTVYTRLGFTVNVGISSNKFLAKMASDFQKPDRTHTLYPDEIPAKMWPLPIGELYGCGHATAERLITLGIRTIGEAAHTDRKTLQSVLGIKGGEYIWRSANGIGSDRVNPVREDAKSISNETTLADDITRNNYESSALPVIRSLSRKVSSRMQKEGVLGQTVTLQVKTDDFQRHSRQIMLSDPTSDPDIIADAACRLADGLLDASGGLFDAGFSVRLIGVGVSRLTKAGMQQMDLFTWAKENQTQKQEKERREAARRKTAQIRRERQKKQQKLDAMLQKVNERFGDGTLKKGAGEK